MDPMLLGETIRSTGVSINHYGFWMPSGGSKGVAAVEVFLVSAADVYTVYLLTKSSDQIDADEAEIGDVPIDSATPGIFKFDVSGARDLVRYKIKHGSEGTSHMHVQLSQPLWAPN